MKYYDIYVYIVFEYFRWIENQFGEKLSSGINVSDFSTLIIYLKHLDFNFI